MVAALSAKEPEDWKQGKLINVDIGSYSRTFGVNGQINTQRRRVFTYSIDAGDKVYQAEEVGRRNAKAIRVDVNGPSITGLIRIISILEIPTVNPISSI